MGNDDPFSSGPKPKVFPIPNNLTQQSYKMSYTNTAYEKIMGAEMGNKVFLSH